MKSTIIAILPLAGFALAESACERQTITKTEYEYASVTVTPVAVKEQTTPTPSICSRRTITTTEIETVTVTVDAPEEEDVHTIDVTSTSTQYTKTTVTVRPSVAPLASTSVLSWGSYPNVTYHASASAQSTSHLPTLSVVYTPTAAAEAVTSSASASILTSEIKVQTPTSALETLTPSAKASASAAGSNTGEATFYGGNVAGGMCSFTGYTIPSSLYGTALSDSNWGDASACGQCVSVTGPTGTQITAMVVDQCPGCGSNHLDLFPDAFEKLADPSKGVISVSWDFVPCGITTPIVLKNKEGTSAHWFSMQVMNANVGVSTLEVSTDGGVSWEATTRQPYNFFENSSGFGTDSVDVKITSVDGTSIVIKDVSVAASTTKAAERNF